MSTTTLHRPALNRLKRRTVKKPVHIAFAAHTQPSWEIKIDGLCKNYGLKRALLPRLSGFSLRSIDGWAAGQQPSAPARQRLTELERLFKALEKLVERKSIGPWLTQPNPAFEGSTPLQVVERGESDRLWQMIYQLGSGQPG